MLEGKRQKQVAGVINGEMNDILRRLGLNIIDGGMVSISSVKVTPDLLEARIYLSFFKVPDPATALKKIAGKQWEIKRELAARIKHQLRRVPVLTFYQDESLEHVFKMEELFKQLHKPEDGDAKAGMEEE